MKWSVDELVQAVGGKILSRKKEGFNSISIDTRLTSDGDSCFFALKGKRDGHDFLNQACEKGAVVLVVSSLEEVSLKEKVTIVQVAHVEKALQGFSSYWRKKLNLKVVGITGSTGKTACKHFCQILFQKDSSMLVSPLNYNNHLGVPLSLLNADENHKTLIQEIGTSRVGEIQSLCQLAQPDISVCTMVGWSHAEGLGGIEDIAQEKQCIYEGARVGIFNLDDSRTREMSFRFKGPDIITFSCVDSSADIFLELCKMDVQFLEVRGSILGHKGSCRIPLSGSHYLCSVMAAVSVATSLGYPAPDIWKSLPLLSSSENRSQWMDEGCRKIFFDAYNANPSSMDAFLKYMEFLIQEKKSVILLLGDMLELGNRSSSFHRELGKKAGSLSVSSVFYVGHYRFDFEKGLKKASFKGSYQSFEKYNKEILPLLKSGEVLAIKASRGVGLNRVIEDMKKDTLKDG